MTDRDRFLFKILSEPGDDTHRLVFADWLDENAGMTCRVCGGDGWDKRGLHGWEYCRDCRGTGTVPNSNAERAEFIRVQCRIAYLDMGDGQLPMGVGREALLQRQRALLDAHEEEWRGPVLARTELWDEGDTEERPAGTYQFVYDVDFRRGFVESVALPAADWLAHHEALYWHPDQTVKATVCKWCKNPQPPEPREVDLDFLCRCGGEWTTGTAPRPFVPTAHPLREVRLTTWPGETPGWVWPVEEWDDDMRHCKFGPWPGLVFENPAESPTT